MSFVRFPAGAIASLVVLAGSLLGSPGCGDSDDECRERDEGIAVDEESPLGLSAAEMISGQEVHGAELTWSDPPSWLPFSQTGATRLATSIEITSNTARVQRNLDTDCRLTLVARVRLDIATEDRALDLSVEGVVTARSDDSFEIAAQLSRDDIEGEFELPPGVALSFSQIVEADGDVEGRLSAWTTEVGSDSTSLKSARIASWSGSTGMIELMLDAGTLPDASSTDAALADEPDEDPVLFDEGVVDPSPDAGLDAG